MNTRHPFNDKPMVPAPYQPPPVKPPTFAPPPMKTLEWEKPKPHGPGWKPSSKPKRKVEL